MLQLYKIDKLRVVVQTDRLNPVNETEREWGPKEQNFIYTPLLSHLIIYDF